MSNLPEIVIYTHKGCLGGARALKFFQSNGVSILVKDILSDPEALEEFKERECFATPVIIIDGKRFIGFDEEDVLQYMKSRHYILDNR